MKTLEHPRTPQKAQNAPPERPEMPSGLAGGALNTTQPSKGLRRASIQPTTPRNQAALPNNREQRAKQATAERSVRTSVHPIRHLRSETEAHHTIATCASLPQRANNAGARTENAQERKQRRHCQPTRRPSARVDLNPGNQGRANTRTRAATRCANRKLPRG